MTDKPMSDTRTDGPVCYVCKLAEDDTLGADGMVKVELRPYGPGGAWVCYDCAMGDPERKAEASRQLSARFDAIEAKGQIIVLSEAGVSGLGEES